MDLQLTKKTAIIFGGSQGIGFGAAEALAKEGTNLVLVSRNVDHLQSAQATLSKYGTVVEIFPANLREEGAGPRAVDFALKKFGSCDIVLCNSGGPAKGPIEKIPSSSWRDDFQNLFLSITETMTAAFPSMREKKFGRFIVITSVAAQEPLPGLTVSNGIRAGVHGLCKSVSNDVAKDGITINTVMPGYTRTDRLMQLGIDMDRITSSIPAGRIGEVQDIGNLVCFLASPLAGYITGQSIAVDGGSLKGNS